MLETSARLLKLLSLLQTRREWGGAELAQRLDVSGRTVRNDIDRLRTLGYPVDATRGAAGGYRLGAGAEMPPLLLDDDEAVAVAVELATASSRGIAGVEESSLRALAKLEQVLPARLWRRVDALRSFAVRVPPNSEGPQADATIVQVLANTCREHEKQRIAYENHSGEASRRIVEPQRLTGGVAIPCPVRRPGIRRGRAGGDQPGDWDSGADRRNDVHPRSRGRRSLDHGGLHWRPRL